MIPMSLPYGSGSAYMNDRQLAALESYLPRLSECLRRWKINRQISPLVAEALDDYDVVLDCLPKLIAAARTVNVAAAKPCSLKTPGASMSECARCGRGPCTEAPSTVVSDVTTAYRASLLQAFGCLRQSLGASTNMESHREAMAAIMENFDQMGEYPQELIDAFPFLQDKLSRVVQARFLAAQRLSEAP